MVLLIQRGRLNTESSITPILPPFEQHTHLWVLLLPERVACHLHDVIASATAAPVTTSNTVTAVIEQPFRAVHQGEDSLDKKRYRFPRPRRCNGVRIAC